MNHKQFDEKVLVGQVRTALERWPGVSMFFRADPGTEFAASLFDVDEGEVSWQGDDQHEKEWHFAIEVDTTQEGMDAIAWLLHLSSWHFTVQHGHVADIYLDVKLVCLGTTYTTILATIVVSGGVEFLQKFAELIDVDLPGALETAKNRYKSGFYD